MCVWLGMWQCVFVTSGGMEMGIYTKMRESERERARAREIARKNLCGDVDKKRRVESMRDEYYTTEQL